MLEGELLDHGVEIADHGVVIAPRVLQRVFNLIERALQLREALDRAQLGSTLRPARKLAAALQGSWAAEAGIARKPQENTAVPIANRNLDNRMMKFPLFKLDRRSGAFGLNSDVQAPYSRALQNAISQTKLLAQSEVCGTCTAGGFFWTSAATACISA